MIIHNDTGAEEDNMKDLKHLTYFENLLFDADNELVKQAIGEGKHALGYTCYFVPEVLLNLKGCFSVRLRAPGTTNTDIGTYYMTNKTCPFTRSILERSMEGGYDFLSAMLSSETCQMMHRAHEYFEIKGLVKDKNPNFYLSMMDVPFVTTKAAYEHYAEQLRLYILEPLSKTYGIDISDDALREAIREHNEICRIITELGDMRKLPNPPITSYEFHVLQLVSECCPQYLIKDKLIETLNEVKKRKTDAKPAYRARIVVTGSEVDDPEFTKLLESCGIYVVADRYCYGSIPGREEIEIRDGETALEAIARHYIDSSECPRFMNEEKQKQRRATLKRLYKDYNADGILYLQMKFCEFWSYERILGVHDMNEVEGIPCIGVEKEYTMASAGQLRTRFQAFVESIEIKKIGKGGKA